MFGFKFVILRMRTFVLFCRMMISGLPSKTKQNCKGSSSEAQSVETSFTFQTELKLLCQQKMNQDLTHL